MLQDRAASEENYRRFIDRSLAGGKVFGLQDKDGGWAVCPSQQYENSEVIVVWSDRAYAARHVKEEWANYSVSEIDLDEFIGAWLRGMHQDRSLVGPNWDANLCGLEVEPIEVAKALTQDDRTT
jgi:hypothetical protein